MPDKWHSYFEPVEWESAQPDYFEPVNFQPPPRTPNTSGGYGLPSLRDIGLTALKMPIQLGEAAAGLGDIATWGNLSKILDPSVPKGWKDYISSFESPELKTARQEFGQAKGFGDTASSVYQNPGLVPLAIEESLPYLAGGMGVARGALRYGPGIGRIGASMLGEAVTGAGTQAAQIREEKGSFGPLDSLYAAGSGAITGLISGGSGKVAQRFGLPDIDAMLADKTVKGVRRIPALFGGGASEAVEEALQSGQEQAGVNLATGKPIGQGVAPGMTMGGITGGVMGSTLPALRRPGAQQTVLPPLPKSEGQRRLTTDVPRQGGTYPSTQYADGSARFVGGEAGIAENRPYTIDMDAPTPGDMQSGSGTVPPSAYSGPTQIPPDLAARRGVGFGQPAGPPTQTDQDLIADLMRRAAKGEDISAELAQLKERGVDLAQPVSPDQPSGQLKSLSVEIPAETQSEETQVPTPEPEPFNLGEYPLQEATNEPENTLRLRIPVDRPRTGGKITYQRINGRNVKFIDGVPEDQAGERELVQEPVLQRTPENESLLRKFFNDDTGTMDFDEMRRRFLAIRKGEPIGDTEKKGVAKFYSKEYRDSLSTQDLQRFLTLDPESVGPDLHREIETELRRRGVVPKPDYSPIDKNLYKGWNWEQGEGKTPELSVEQRIENHAEAIRNETDPQRIKDNLDDLKRQVDSLSPNANPVERTALLELYKIAEITFNRSTRAPVQVLPKLKPIAGGRFGELPGKTDDSYTIAKRNLDERNRRGEVVDYVEELEELNRQHGVIDTMSNEMSSLVDEIRSAGDQGFVTLNPKSHHAPRMKREGWTLAGRLSDGTLVLDYPPGPNSARVGKLYQARGEQGIRTRIPNEKIDEPAEMSDKDKGKRVKDLEDRMDRAYRAGDTKEVVKIGQELQEIAEAESRFGGGAPRNTTKRAFQRSLGQPGSDPNPQETRRIRDITYIETAKEMGIDPYQFKHIEEVAEAILQNRIVLTGAAKELSEIQSKINYYEKTGNSQGLKEAYDQMGQLHERNREGARQEALDRIKQQNPDVAEMRVPNSTNVALGPYIEGGKGKGLFDALGTALYRRDRPSTWVKEGFQNANDERKISKNTEPIRVVFRYDVKNPVTGAASKSVIVQDGGRGMNPQQLYSVFSNVGETGKANEIDASGGFGFAKASPFLGGTFMRITSINKEGGKTFKHTFEGNPEQFKEQEVGVPLTTVQVLNSTKTGFTAEVFYPFGQSLHGAKNLIEKTVTNTPGMDNIHVFSDYFDDSSTHSSTKQFLEYGTVKSHATSEYQQLKGSPLKPKIATIVIPGAEIDLHYELDNIERQNGTIYYLNNGTYALEGAFSAWPVPNLPGLPKSISANVRATVEEGQPGYPFTLNREELLGDTESEVKKWINDNIIEPAKNKKRDEIQHLYDTLPTNQTANGTSFISLDSGEKYTPAELARFRNAKEVHAVADIMGNILDRLTVVFPESWRLFGDTEKFGFRTSQPEDGGVNIPNNRDVMPSGRKKTANLINLLGIAVYPEKAEPWQTAQGIVHAIGHEFAHNRTRPEDQVTWAIYDLFKKWDLREQHAYAEQIRKAITGPDGRYTPEFERLLQEYSDSRGRPVVVEDILSRQRESTFLGENQPDGIAEMANGDKPKREGTPRKFGGYPREPRKSSTRDAGKAAATGKNQQAPITPETQSIRYPATSIRRLKEALQSGKLLQPYKLRMQSLERSRRAGAISGVKDPGMKGYFQKLGMLRGPLTPEIPIETRLTQADLDNLMAGITNSTLMPYSKLRAQTGIMKLFAGQIPTGSESRLLGKVFGEDLPQLIQLHAGLGFTHPDDIKKFLYGAINIPKSLMSSLDLSYTLRQAAPFMLTKEYWNSFAEMWKAFPGKQGNEAFDGAMQSIYDDPVYDFFQEFDRPLFIGEFKAGSDLAHREEAFGSDIAAKIPLMAGMGRMQTAFINKLRFDVAKRMLNDMYKSGYIDWAEGQEGAARDKSRQDVQRMLDFVNNFTGRGNLGAAARFGPLLNSAFFSPAFQMSRFHILASPITYLNAPPVVRREAWKSMFAIGSMLGLGIALTKAMGGDVEDDPNSTDWGKGRFGNTRVDFSQGLQPILVAGSRIASGKSVSPDKVDASGRLIPGKSYDLGKTFTGPTIRSIIGNFLINKASPAGGLINVWSQGEQAFPPGGIGGIQFPGKQQGNMSKAAALNMVIPMVVNDMVDLYKEDPNISPRGMSFLIASVLGLPVQTFDEPEQKNPFERQFQLRPPMPPGANQQYTPPPQPAPPAEEQGFPGLRIGITIPRRR